MKVALLVKGAFANTPEDLKRDVQTVFLPLVLPNFAALAELQTDLVFDLYASTGLEQAVVATALESAGLPFTGSSALGHFLALNKSWAKSVWRSQGLPTPTSFDDQPPTAQEFPLIVKPTFGGAGEGIYCTSLVHNPQELKEQLTWMAPLSPLTVEQYIPGREITVGILGDPPRVLPPLEIGFDRLPEELPPILSYEAKTRFVELLNMGPARLDRGLAAEIGRICLAAFQSLGLRDYGRVDLRLDPANQPYLLEINSLPGLQPDYSDMPRAAALAGINFRDLVWEIANLTLARKGKTHKERMP
ncbi:MAG: ATP-grasp domain-containing protein [Coprothermobacterota bacterium]|nr:ATP-grasp domain-containing protein [Coprothermobacterota bacterium]